MSFWTILSNTFESLGLYWQSNMFLNFSTVRVVHLWVESHFLCHARLMVYFIILADPSWELQVVSGLTWELKVVLDGLLGVLDVHFVALFRASSPSLVGSNTCIRGFPVSFATVCAIQPYLKPTVFHCTLKTLYGHIARSANVHYVYLVNELRGFFCRRAKGCGVLKISSAELTFCGHQRVM